MADALSPRALKLLKALERNNDRDWYDANRDAMKRELLEPFAGLLEAASARLARTAIPLKGGRKTMYRMNRDTRFSANKLPYKIHVGGLLTVDGTKKSEGQGLGYLHCEPGASFAAAGFYMPETRRLEPVRRAMLEDAVGWRRVLRALDKAGLALDGEHRLTSMPRGFNDARDHEHADSVKLKSLTVGRKLPDKAWTSGAALDELVDMVRATRPLIEFVRAAT